MSDGTSPRTLREVERFGRYLRYGIVLPEEENEQERKFNPYHDPTTADSPLGLAAAR